MPTNTPSATASAKPLGDLAATSLNHLTHGGCSQTLFLPTEDPAKFFALLAAAFEEYRPNTALDAGLVTDSVLARWFLLRRQTLIAEHEAALHKQKPQRDQWTSADLNYLQLLERYRTQAERSFKRAVSNLAFIKKIDVLAEQHWQAQHELQKERLGLDCERFQLAKQREVRIAERNAKQGAAKQTSKEDFPPKPDSASPSALHPDDSSEASQSPAFEQVLYIGLQGNVPIITEITPSNLAFRCLLQEGESIARTYNFIGNVPEQYRHLITPDAQTFGTCTSVRKIHTFKEWNSLADYEDWLES